jgi:hypothetical protein
MFANNCVKSSSIRIGIAIIGDSGVVAAPAMVVMKVLHRNAMNNLRPWAVRTFQS